MQPLHMRRLCYIVRSSAQVFHKLVTLMLGVTIVGLRILGLGILGFRIDARVNSRPFSMLPSLSEVFEKLVKPKAMGKMHRYVT